MTGLDWLEDMGMSGLSLDNTAMAPLVNANDETGGDSLWLPTTLSPHEYVDQMSDHGGVSSDAHMSSGVVEHGIYARGYVQSHVLGPSRPVDPGYCCRTNMIWIIGRPQSYPHFHTRCPGDD